MPVDDLHPDAAANFAARAQQLVAALRPAAPISGGAFRGPEPRIAKAFESHEILSFGHLSSTDPGGEEIARAGVVDGTILQLDGDAYREFLRLVQSVHKTPQLCRAVAFETIRETLFDWLLRRRTGRVVDELHVFLLQHVGNLVRPLTIVIPVYELGLESPRRIGNVELRPIEAEQIEAWMRQLVEQRPDFANNVHYVRERWSKRMQGRASSLFTVEAEPRRARELAMTETERSLAALRLFSPGNLHPTARSLCVPWGRQHLLSEFVIWIDQGAKIESEEGISARGGPPFWLVPDDTFDFFWQNGLQELSNLLAADSRSALEEDLLKGLLVYSRTSLSSDVTEKLLHVFVMLESLLLKDENEPIAASVAERVAFVVGKHADERIAIARCVKDAYGLRSRFVHHGASVDDLDTVRMLMHHAFDCYIGVLRNRRNFSDRKDLLSFLEKRKFSSP